MGLPGLLWGGIPVRLGFLGIPRDSVRRAFRRYVVEAWWKDSWALRAVDPGAEGANFGAFGLLENFWGILDVFERFRAEYRE